MKFPNSISRRNSNSWKEGLRSSDKKLPSAPVGLDAVVASVGLVNASRAFNSAAWHNIISSRVVGHPRQRKCFLSLSAQKFVRCLHRRRGIIDRVQIPIGAGEINWTKYFWLKDGDDGFLFCWAPNRTGNLESAPTSVTLCFAAVNEIMQLAS
jgi:hypothetical protein